MTNAQAWIEHHWLFDQLNKLAFNHKKQSLFTNSLQRSGGQKPNQSTSIQNHRAAGSSFKPLNPKV